jgi:hypothetical protein
MLSIFLNADRATIGANSECQDGRGRIPNKIPAAGTPPGLAAYG